MLGMTACQKSESFDAVSGDVDITVSTSLPAQMDQTRAAGDGTTVNRCIMEIYLDGELYGERQVAAVENLSATFSVRLVAGKTFDLVFWADKSGADINSDLHYNTADLANVAFTGDYIGNDDARDAFFGTAQVAAGESQAVNVELRRPFGQLNVKTLDMAEVAAASAALVPSKVKIAFDEVPTGINLLTGELTGDAEAVAYADAAALANNENNAGELSFDYVFAPKAAGEQRLVNFTMSFLNDAGTEVASAYEFSNIPVQRNYRTNVSGNLLTKKADINVEVKPEFDGVIEPWDGESLKAVTPVSKEFDGAVRDVYCIYSPAEMAWIADQLNAGNNQIKYLEIENDIDMGGYALAITRASNIVLEGQGYTLSNYSVEKNTQSAGLFCDAVSVTVRNLTIENANVKAVNDGNGNAYAGALMGRTYGTIVLDNVHSVNSTVEGVNKVGGLVGFVAENHIEATNCSVSGGSVSTSYVEGESGQIGGLIGYLGSLFGSECVIRDCSVENTVINAYMTREDRTVSKFIGCFQGNQATDVVTIDNCHVSNVTFNALDDMAASHFSQYGDLLGGQRYGNGTVNITNSETANLISTRTQLENLAAAVNNGNNFSKIVFRLENDIDLENEPWTPIGKSDKTFNGIFDGNGHTISNLMIDTPSKSDVGFFGFTQQGEIKNLNFHNATVKGYLDVGVVAGTPYTSKYSDITLTGTIKVDGYSYVGGMFGKNAYADLTDLTIDADDESYVKAESENYRTYVGGVVGFMGEGSIDVTNVVSNINVTGSTCDVGGISGNIHYGNTFTNCSCSGDVTLTGAQDEGDQLEIGGIAGTWVNTQSQVKFSGCSFTGKLTTFLNGEDRTGDLTETHKTVGRQWSTTGSGTLIIE